ncbi:terminase [Corynebacterium callunae]|uniref:terminase n=1 Tax=Corynebacterium callunae TaxID=1721 RepID=UPI0039825878
MAYRVASQNEVAAADRLITLPPGIPERTLGYEALAWAAKYLRHPNGKRAGQRWQFTREQARFILWFYAVDECGYWIYSSGERRLAKGSGKSPFAAVLALLELFAPVRFLRFDDRVPGGVIGQPVKLPWVQIAAVSREQTKNTFRMITAMVSKKNAPQLHRDYDFEVYKTQIQVAGGGKLETITSAASTQEGAEITAAICDETEHWLPQNGGVELFSTIVDNLSKSGNRVVCTLNAWKPGLNSVGEKNFDEWCLQEVGRSKGGKTLYDARMAPPDTDLSDEKSLRNALEFVYADCPWALEQISSMIKRIWNTQTSADDSKRKYLNWPTVDTRSWADPKNWAQMARPDIEVEPGERIAMFFDGSLSNDTTALVGCRISDGHIFKIGFWEPPEEGIIDVESVAARVSWAKETYQVAGFFADVREWESFTKLQWPEEFRDTLEIMAVPGGKAPQWVAWDMRSKTWDFTQACELVEREILELGFTHDGDADLGMHVRNMRRHENRYGISVKKETPKSSKKIDLGVCMIGARMVRQLVLAGDSEQTFYDGEVVTW